MKKIISNIITWIILIVILAFTFKIYKKNNFNDFVRSETNLHTSQFTRDKDVKYSKNDSYKVVSNQANDAAFYKNVKVKKNMPYKVTCMVKTENVEPEEEISGIGAQISIIGTTEKSVAITGTQDWQKIEFIFNSKNRETVDIGFRLGGYLGKCTGIAWFSDFSFEEGTKDDNNKWKFACFIFENTDVQMNGTEVKLSMTGSDIYDITDTISRFQNNIPNYSENKMTAECYVYKVTTPITKLSYDKEFGYYVAAEDIEDSIKEVINQNDFDHIFAIIKLGNEEFKNNIQINDWIGLRFYGLLWNRIFKYKATKFFTKLYI